MKLGRNDRCPCGSGNKYKKCCINKNFNWIPRKEGKFYRDFKIEIPGLEEFLVEQKREFKQLFGRELGPEDPLFFQQYLKGEDQYKDEFIKVMRQFGLGEEYIYAYKVTGRIVTSENKDYLTDFEYEEWSNTVKKYLETQSQKNDSLGDNQSTLLILEEFERCIYIVGMIVNKCGIIESLEMDKYINQKDYILYCLTKTLKTLKAVLNQLLNSLPEDSLNLLRSIYENYLNIVLIIHNPERLEDLTVARIGLNQGTHDYVKNSKGHINKRVIYNKLTGQEYDAHISNYVMAKSSDYEIDIEIFDMFYEYLSRFTHPNVLSLSHYISNNKFDPFKEAVLFEDIAVMCIYLICFILDEVLSLQLGSEVNNDISIFLNRIKPNLDKSINREGEIGKIMELFRLRSQYILERY